MFGKQVQVDDTGPYVAGKENAATNRLGTRARRGVCGMGGMDAEEHTSLLRGSPELLPLLGAHFFSPTRPTLVAEPLKRIEPVSQGEFIWDMRWRMAIRLVPDANRSRFHFPSFPVRKKAADQVRRLQKARGTAILV
jgi:hypothetical protein